MKRLKATSQLEQAVNFSDIFLIALPTKAIRNVVTEIDQHIKTKNVYSRCKRY